ncbi:MAG: aldose 1-epimerase family protein [Clostridia bacterium]|nr:aldose 1-epimerase family protein [Clostridia bacterium]
MIYTIQNDFLTVSVSDIGAELTSIMSKDGCEYLWQGDEKYWSGRAPIMFPICGRLFNGEYTYLGKTYKMPSHGIARASTFSLESISKDSLTLQLKGDENTKQSYPFDFTLDVTFALKGNTLDVRFKVKNNDEKELIFGIGGHPAFNVPINDEGFFEDWYVELDKRSDAFRVDFSPTCFLTKNDKLYNEKGTKRIDLWHDLFDNDAIFLYNTSKKITLASERSKRSVTLCFDGMKYVGLWHAVKKDAPYLCIEPWTSVPATDGKIDDLLTKDEMIHLPSGYTYKNSFSITIC